MSAINHRANTWNETENLYSYGVIGEPAPPLINTQDQLEGRFWTDSSGNNVGRTQAEIEAYVVGLAAEFMKNCPGKKTEHTAYNEILTGSELVEAQDFNCL